MRQDIKREMLEYFKNIPNPTPQESRFLLYLDTEIDFFDIIYVSRDDIYAVEYDASCLSDKQMERLADKIGDCYCNNGFWDDLASLLDDMEIPKLEQ